MIDKEYSITELVTITVEEYKYLKQIEKVYNPFWFCAFGGCEGVCKECIDSCEQSILVKAKQEFYTDILKLEAHDDGWNKLYQKAHIDQLAKKHHLMEVENSDNNPQDER